MWTRLADWVVMSNGLPQRGRRAGVWAAWESCLCVCNHVYIHVLGELKTIFLSLRSGDELKPFHLAFYHPKKWRSRVSVRSQ